jgi:transposase
MCDISQHRKFWSTEKMSLNSEGTYLTSFQRHLLHENMKKELPNSYKKRLEIILLTDDGKTQAEICRVLGCSTATASRWIQLTKTGLAHKYLDCPVGRPKIVTDEYIEFLQRLLQNSPRDYGYPFKTWTINWLGKHLAKEMGIEVSESHLKRVMRDLGLSTRSSSAQAQLSKAQSEKYTQSGANIFIADLKCPHDQEENELSESNLLQIKLDSRIYGSASSSTTYLSGTTQRNLAFFADNTRVSILS